MNWTLWTTSGALGKGRACTLTSVPQWTREQGLVLALGDMSSESHCATACKWCDLGQVILPVCASPAEQRE